jgi:hypothetical protein
VIQFLFTVDTQLAMMLQQFLSVDIIFFMLMSCRMFDVVQELFKQRHAELDREEKKKQAIRYTG